MRKLRKLLTLLFLNEMLEISYLGRKRKKVLIIHLLNKRQMSLQLQVPISFVDHPQLKNCMKI